MIVEMGKAGVSVTTIRYVLRIIHRVLRDAVRKGRLSRNVADLVDPPPERKPEGKAWDEVEFDHFLTVAAGSESAIHMIQLAVKQERSTARPTMQQ